MAFNCKFPVSRRQNWEKQNNSSQFAANRKPDVGKRQIDSVDVGTVVPSGAPVPRSHRKEGFTKPNGEDISTVTVCSPNLLVFTKTDLIFAIVSIALYLVDVGTDCYVAYFHYAEIDLNPLYFYFTISFIIVAWIVTSIFSLWWYFFEYKFRLEMGDAPRRSWLFIRIITSVFMMGPVMRSIDTIRLGQRLRDKTLKTEMRLYFHNQLQYEKVDGAMLRLFEAFLEAAPQILLQVFIFLHKGIDGEKEGNVLKVAFTMASVVSSMLSLAWSIVSYHKALRESRPDRKTIRFIGIFLRFLWNAFEVNPRIVIFAMFMSIHTYWLGVFAAIHTFIMFFWIRAMQSNFCEKPSCEGLFIFVAALIWSFCFFNVKDGHTRKRSLMYYVIFYIENYILTTLWAIHPNTQSLWYRPYMLTVGYGSVLPMTLSMLIYYKCAHPENIQTCLPSSYWCCCKKEKRYSGRDGSGSEKQNLTVSQSPPLSPEPSKETKIEMTQNQESSPHMLDGSGDHVSTNGVAPFEDVSGVHLKPNLDDCIEINGYLEKIPQVKLQREDTLPRYPAPVPNRSSYGVTVPGGAPSILAYSKSQQLRDKGQGQTLPGQISSKTVVENGRDYVPLNPEEDACNNDSSYIVLSSIEGHKPPIPQPRHSLRGTRDNSSDDSTLTVVTDLPENLSSFLAHTLSPSVVIEDEEAALDCIPADLSDVSFDVNLYHMPTKSCESSHVADTTHSSIDTPLKSNAMYAGPGSPNTPEKSLMNKRLSRPDY